ncbi:hypothetical protein JKF63_04137 [Porcisia hertigi]|uniref:TROVE domain-containing protein n=1 Tax=Porcisia hertigi TaxID=2761500 RepID=A0A836HL87_9TRYP|nr:hypothetical protein JKF63_04137 [Porcisia hertigi]
MEFFYKARAAELTLLKTKLVDLVSSCLMKEPPFEAALQELSPAGTEPAAGELTAEEEGAVAVSASPALPPNGGAATVAQIRALVHLISRQDGEFVLKLALYARHELHLRRSPSFLVALCAREPNCLPCLQAYMEKIIVLPSDWLAVANFAYFHDCDAAHDYAETLAYPPRAQGEAHATGPNSPRAQQRFPSSSTANCRQGRYVCRSPGSTDRCRSTPSGADARSSAVNFPRASPSAGRAKTEASPGRHQNAAPRDPRRSYIPAALRSALVVLFARFSVFSMAKYDNEAAEHRAKRRLVRRNRRVVAPSHKGASDDELSTEDGQAVTMPRPGRPQTFTFKQLIRMLHITEPAYIVCCLLGKRYPENEADFRSMRLHLTDPTWKMPEPLKTRIEPSAKGDLSATGTSGRAHVSRDRSEIEDKGEGHGGDAGLPFCVFDARRAGQRMRLPVPETWETLLSQEGNTGRVWDALISAEAVPYMALLRNLRNILTRRCSAKTHQRVLERLVDEQQIAASRQLPYRFYSAYLAVQQIRTSLTLLDTLRAMPREARSAINRAVSARGCGRHRRGGAAVASKSAAEPFSEALVEAAQGFERPMVSRVFLHRYVMQYCAALDFAVNTSARLNVIPMKGTSIVIICVTSALFEPLSAMGASTTAPASIQRKVDVAALLAAMLMRSCEQCIVLLYCYDEYVLFQEWDLREGQSMVDEACERDSDSFSGWDTDSSTCSQRNEAHDDGVEGADSRIRSNPFHQEKSTASREAAPRILGLVGVLTARCFSLLERKRKEVDVDRLSTSFAMFADGAGAHFPYAFLDEVIERNMRVESLLVLDEGVHRTYANMNRNAPAFGDLPVYLSRLRRRCSPDLVYVGVNLKASSPPAAKRINQVPEAAATSITASVGVTATPKSAAAVICQPEEVRLRFDHPNDILITGFSDSILRLVAERTRGGPLSVIERSAETYHVSRFRLRACQATWVERARALKVVAAFRKSQQRPIGGGGGGGGSPAMPRTASAPAIVDGINSGAPSGCNVTATNLQDSSLPSTRRPPTAMAMAVPAVVLPSFDAEGKAVLSTGWDWGRISHANEPRLQWLTSSTAGLTPIASASEASLAFNADTESKSRAALPSIHRLLAKPSLSESDVPMETTSFSGPGSSRGAPVDSASHWDDAEVRKREPAWLAAEGKHVSPIFCPQPFISIVKLFSMSSSTRGVRTTTSATGAAASVADHRKEKRTGDAPLKSQRAQLGQTGPLGSAETDVFVCGAAAASTPTTARIPCVSEGEKYATRHRQHNPARHSSPAASAVVRRLITSNRVCRFFISSTFLDMNNERNAVTLDVFPRLRRWAAEAGLKVTLLEVDLRWGIPALATRRNLSTSVCLNEVSRCSPFFIGMLGARYGSCPPTPLQLVVDEDVDAEDYAWMQELANPHVSVTELEMRHAMYNSRRRLGESEVPPSVLFFTRDSPHLLSTFGPTESACRAVYEADSATAAEAIARLKQRIEENGCTLVSYQAEYIRPSKAHLSDTSGCSGGGDSTRSAALCSSTQAMRKDDLGRWTVRSRHGFGGGAEEDPSSSGSAGSGSTTAREGDSLWSLVKSRITESEEPRTLTSMDVAIDMTDFSNKVFRNLQEVICRVCGVCPVPDDDEEERQQQHAAARLTDPYGLDTVAETCGSARASRKAAPLSSGDAGADAPDEHEMFMIAQSEFARKLSDLYAAPRGLLEQLSSFALSGSLGAASDHGVPKEASAKMQRMVSTHDTTLQGDVTPSSLSEGVHDGRSVQGSAGLLTEQSLENTRGRASCEREDPQNPPVIGATAQGAGTGSILLLEGSDGDGKSSALAALAVRVLGPMGKTVESEASPRFLFYSAQAEDDSARGLLLFLAKSFQGLFQLFGEVSVSDTDSVDDLILALNHVYDAIKRRSETAHRGPAMTSGSNGEQGAGGDGSVASLAESGAAHRALVVMLDGLDKSSEAAEIVSLLGAILHPLATQHIRFVLSACPWSPLARALRTRTAPVCILTVPILSEGERATLVRLHLAHYGKLLEESFTADELKHLLRKSDSGRPSYLISAITHLRLFSTFDTLREDIRLLPASRAALHVQLLHHLQSRFDPATCRLVLSILVLRQPVGGVLEFNLYRLVSDVAAASRLVTLLRGICLDSHHGRLIIKSSTFFDAIARAFFRFTSDYQCAQERLLLAELCYRAIDVSLDEQEVRDGLRRVTESIQRSAANPLVQRTFVPERYAPRELFGVLQGSVQACRLDVTAALVCYLPFLEGLLVNRRMLSQLVGLLSSVLSATATASSLALDASRSEGDGAAEDGCSVRTFASHRALAIQWRQYRSEARRLGDVLSFLQKNYHVLIRQPVLLRQCVWNAVGPAVCISAYDAASTKRLQHTLQHMRASSVTDSHASNAHPQGKRQRPEDATNRSPPAPLQNMPAPSALSMMWVHWLNARQHGGEGRLMLATASPRSIRSMSMSPDGAEVALGGDDGVLRRVPTDDEEQQQQPLHLMHTDAEDVGGAGSAGRYRAASTLRHESAVTAVLYVTPRTTDGLTAGTSGSGTSAALPVSTDAAQLLVSGCARGLLYVWRLEDNTLLQRGFGHLRAISGLVCHPLEPAVLCSSSHDSFVKLWAVAGAEATSKLCSEIQTALDLRMPKYPAGSAERLQQERLRRRARGSVAGELYIDGGGARSTAVRHNAHALSTLPYSNQASFQTSLTPFHTERQHHTPVADVAFHRSGDVFASGSWDGVLVLHNTRELCTPSPVIPLDMKVPPQPPRQLRFAGRRSHRVESQWRTRHGPEHRQVAFQSTKFALGSPVRALCFSNSLAVTCVVGCHNGTVVIVDYASASVVARWGSLHSAPVTRLSASLDGQCMASADEHGVVRLTYTGITGSVFSTLNGHNGAVTGLCFRPPRVGQGEDEGVGSGIPQAPRAVLLSAGEDRTLQAWRVDTGGTGGFGTQSPMSRRRLSVAHFAAITAVASSRDGHLLVTGSADGVAIVYRMPEESDDIACRWASGAAASGGCTGAAELRRSKTWGKRASSVSMTSGCGLRTRGPLDSAFTLKHDGCRITRICLALHDTRIVVGVAFGLVYVWSSSPGLNQVEGRLLLRVRVPEHGLYPVISLGIVERCSAGSIDDYRCRCEAQGARNAQETYGEVTTLALESPPLPGCRHTGSSAAAATILTSPSAESDDRRTETVTAVCANGDVAVFEVLDDAASHFLAADQARRRQRRAADHTSNFSDGAFKRSDSFCTESSEDVAERPTAGDDVVVAPPAATGFGRVERREVEPFAECTIPAASLPAHVGVTGSTSAEVGGPQPTQPRTGSVEQGEARTSVANSSRPLPQRATLNETLRHRRQALDERAMRLQRLLSRCRKTELELRNGYRLRLHRHRLQWADTSEAEEITSVVWLSPQHPQHPQRSRVAGASDAMLAHTVEGRQLKLAFVVAQRRLFMLLSNGYEGALSRCSTLRVSSVTHDGAAVLASTTGAMPNVGMAVRPPLWDTGSDATKAKDDAVPPKTSENAAPEELEVDLDYLLREDEYFTSASSAVEVPPAAPTKGMAEATGKFAVAVTTSNGEVLLFRVQVPLCHGTHADALGVPTAQSIDAGAKSPSAVSQCLSSYILPNTTITLCRRLGFTHSTTGQAASAPGNAADACTSGATLHRITTTPQATSVELCPLPLELKTALDASATSLPSAPSVAEMGSVVLFAGCTDGSTRVWLTAVHPPPPHSHCGSAAGEGMVKSLKWPCIGSVRDTSIGSFFCSSGVTVVSGFLNGGVRCANGRGVFAPASPLRWIVGDALGNLYQLQLERDAPGGVDALLDKARDMLSVAAGGSRSSDEDIIEGRLARLAAEDTNTSPWSQSLQGLLSMMSHPPLDRLAQATLTSSSGGDADRGELTGDATKASEAVSTLLWPGWGSRTPVEWLAPVDVSSTLPRLLRRGVSAISGRADVVPEWGYTDRNAQSTMRSSSTCAEGQELGVGGEGPQLLDSARLQSSAHVGLVPAQWSCLPNLPQVKQADTAAFSHAVESTAEGVYMRNSDEHVHLTPLGGTGFSSPPTALPSFATAPCASGSVWERPGAHSDGGEVSVEHSFRMPLTSLLGAYRRQEAGAVGGTSPQKSGSTAATVDPPRHGQSNASTHLEVPAALTTTPLSILLANSPSTPQDDQVQQPRESGDDDDYFAVLYKAEPPISHTPGASGAEARRAWLLHQNEVLREAMRVQRYNKLARRALEAYHSRSAATHTAVGL